MKKIVSSSTKDVINIDNISLFNIHVYRNREKVYKLVWLESGKYNQVELCGFIDLMGNTASEPNFVSINFKESVELAIQAGYHVFQIENPFELLELLSNELNSI